MTVERRDPKTELLGPLLTVEDVAALLRISKTGVYRLVEQRALACSRVGRALRFQRRDLETYLRACRVDRSAQLDPYERTQTSP